MRSFRVWEIERASDGLPVDRILSADRRRTVLDGDAKEYTALGAANGPRRISFSRAEPGSVVSAIGGWVGELTELARVNGLKCVDIDALVAPFFDHRDTGGGFRGEFWGKWALAVIDSLRSSADTELEAILTQSVERILSSQELDGYIGTYDSAGRLVAFDVWNQKYTVWGLLAYSKFRGDPRGEAAAVRALEALQSELERQRTTIPKTGIDVLGGLGSSSILHPISLLASENPEMLELAHRIVDGWENGAPAGIPPIRLLSGIRAKRRPFEISSAKAYEMMSCLEGVAELSRVTADEELANLVVDAAEAIARDEITILGSGSNWELWARSARSQTRATSQPQETCVTTYWMRLARQALDLTGEARFAEAIETSLFNALAGAMNPSGAWWNYFTPLVGHGSPSHSQFTDIHLSCCVLNGYRGLFMTSEWAVEAVDDSLRFNTYLPGTYDWVTSDQSARVEISGSYPFEGGVFIKILPETPVSRWRMRLRIPSWSATTAVTVNGVAIIRVEGGTWLDIERDWSPGDSVAIEFDLSLRVVHAPDDVTSVAIVRGPIVLALDGEYHEPSSRFLWLTSDGLSRSAQVNQRDARQISVDVKFENRLTHYFDWTETSLRFSDFASVSAQASISESRYSVWLPQPMFDASDLIAGVEEVLVL